MLIADIKGKLSLHEEVSEDFLTSAVFSTFDYLPKKYLKKYLETAINLDTKNLSLPEENDIHLVFWKRFSIPGGRTVEPDVLIFWGHICIIIEAKFYSGKSGIGFIEEEDNATKDQLKKQLIDQLARQYFLGLDTCARAAKRSWLTHQGHVRSAHPYKSA